MRHSETSMADSYRGAGSEPLTLVKTKFLSSGSCSSSGINNSADSVVRKRMWYSSMHPFLLGQIRLSRLEFQSRVNCLRNEPYEWGISALACAANISSFVRFSARRQQMNLRSKAQHEYAAMDELENHVVIPFLAEPLFFPWGFGHGAFGIYKLPFVRSDCAKQE